MVSGRKLIINWLIKSKAIKDNERELYEYALYSIFSPIQSDNRIIAEDEKHIYRKIVMQQLAIYVVVAIIADIAGKEIVTICMFLGIIITAVMQVPCIVRKVK